jgi:hypothetical protein
MHGTYARSLPPVDRQPLSDEQIDAIFAASHNVKDTPWLNWRTFARAIERALAGDGRKD